MNDRFKVIKRQLLKWKLGFNLVRKLQTCDMLNLLNPLKDELVLDVGCGEGNLSSEIASKGSYVVGMDFNPKLVQTAKARSRYSGQSSEFVVGDAKHLPFKEETFDKVLISSVLQHINNDNAVINQVNHVMKLQSTLVVNVPTNRPYLYLPLLLGRKYIAAEKKLFTQWQWIHKYSLRDLKRKLEKAFFKITDLRYSPKFIGAMMYELDLFLRVIVCKYEITKSNPIFAVFTPARYFLSFADRLLPKETIGSEFTVKAVKARQNSSSPV